MRVQRKLQRKKYDELRKRAARQRRLAEQNKKALRLLNQSCGFNVANLLTITREDFLAGHGCDCDDKTPHTHKVQPIEITTHFRTLMNFVTHTELDIAGANTLYPYTDNYYLLEHCRAFWIRLEQDIESVRSGEMRRALWEVVGLTVTRIKFRRSTAYHSPH